MATAYKQQANVEVNCKYCKSVEGRITLEVTSSTHRACNSIWENFNYAFRGAEDFTCSLCAEELSNARSEAHSAARKADKEAHPDDEELQKLNWKDEWSIAGTAAEEAKKEELIVRYNGTALRSADSN